MNTGKARHLLLKYYLTRATLLLAGAGDSIGSTLVPFATEPRFAHADFQKVKLTRTVHQDKRVVESPVINCRDETGKDEMRFNSVVRRQPSQMILGK